MHNRKSGFTLMEIMVVIIVIAVLASVAGPMIGSITDQGRASATKSKMSALKSALLAYQSDVGRLPFTGNKGNSQVAASYNAFKLMSYTNSEKNVLLTENFMPTLVPNYSRKWKGPYMDAEPSDFMYDSWGNPLLYVAEKDGNNVYLWSYGPDGEPDDLANATNITKALKAIANNTGDDIITSVYRSRRKFNK